ncbi:MAG TPA: TIGR03790 family protein [Geoalkalibacter subterraneus]|uniref:TIGR03790 family protein n=1 Tax=Geoalkalibacter subterraneus TaxID=483547 RepID=A0A831LF26_9BACT|nr:TIGR03790 family protein [Geoalkalibacter subterraneus]
MKINALFFLFFLLLAPCFAYALQPSEVAVVYNSFVEESTSLAKYYMKARNIPSRNLIKTRPPHKESISRKDFDRDIVGPVRKALMEKSGEIRALVVMYGVPLKVGAPQRTSEEEERFQELTARRDELRNSVDGDDVSEEERSAAEKQLKIISEALKDLSKKGYSAAVDSELTLVLVDDYPLADWIDNPLFVGNKDRLSSMPAGRDDILMVSRLDGPSPAIVRRMIDDSLAAEEKGLQGRAYFDARWKRPDNTDVSGSGFYDLSIHRAADRVRKSGRMPVVVNDDDTLFQPAEAPETALYCGWYSLARYVDAFEWQPGSVGIHIASQECQTLRSGSSRVWCKRMLEEGAAAVVGPVGEPYLQAFPVPEAFFSFLIDGYYTLVESYMLSLPWLSWKMVLVGDPLYRPFAAK